MATPNPRPRRSFTAEYKLKVIKWYHANGESIFNSSHYFMGAANVVGVTEDLKQMPGATTYRN